MYAYSYLYSFKSKTKNDTDLWKAIKNSQEVQANLHVTLLRSWDFM